MGGDLSSRFQQLLDVNLPKTQAPAVGTTGAVEKLARINTSKGNA